MTSVVVTGASTGIGWGCVKVLAGKGLHVFGSVRKQNDAERLKAEFGDSVTPLLFDVTDAGAVNRAAEHAAGAIGNPTRGPRQQRWHRGCGTIALPRP